MKTADVSPDLPEITNQELDEWLANTERSGRTAYQMQLARYEAVKSGDLPLESFDLDQFEALKRTLAITRKMRSLLTGVFGAKPGPVPDDVDEQFFSIMSNLYGYDVTKGRTDCE
jgi:hypothetical protein